MPESRRRAILALVAAVEAAAGAFVQAIEDSAPVGVAAPALLLALADAGAEFVHAVTA